MTQYAFLVPLLPLIGFLINGIGFKRVPKNLVGIIGAGSVLVSFIITAIIFCESLKDGSAQTILLFDWIHAGSVDISFSFQIDRLSILFMMIVTGVGFLIHVYSVGYMHHDEGFGKFFAYLNLFMFSMLVLVMGSNYVMMFIGWEGVGLCSFLLIGFWFKNKDYTKAANKAFIMNRIGDLGFLLGIFLIFITFGTSEFSAVFGNANAASTTVVTSITLLLFVGAIGKSAQIPLFTWLPDAMAGPTPVSALIHAATMVTAGIYMIARSNILYSMAPITGEVVTIVGVMTALIAALTALTQNDIKKVLAYSTVSQLGYMFVALGLESYGTSVFHVMTHAFFKALLFLCAGSVIHAMSNEQNMRKMGGLKKYLPVTYLTMGIGTLAISCIPPFAGFFSKDEILATAYTHNFIVFALLCVTSVLTAAYMFRMFFMTFHGEFRGTKEQQHHLHESPKSMTVPLMVLAVLASVGGFLGLPGIFGEDKHALRNFLSPVFSQNPRIENAEAGNTFEIFLTIASIVILALIIKLAMDRYAKKKIEKEVYEDEMKPIYKLSYRKFYFDEIYDAVVVNPLEKMSFAFHKYIDKGFIDKLVNGVGSATVTASSWLRNIQTGNIGFYVLMMVLGIVAMIFFGVVKHI